MTKCEIFPGRDVFSDRDVFQIGMFFQIMKTLDSGPKALPE
jgi:hypothetical protein